MDWKKILEERKFFRRATLIWAIVQITAVVWYVLLFTPEIVTGTATMASAVIGILTGVIGFYQWSRKEDDNIAKKMKMIGDRGVINNSNDNRMNVEKRDRKSRRIDSTTSNN